MPNYTTASIIDSDLDYATWLQSDKQDYGASLSEANTSTNITSFWGNSVSLFLREISDAFNGSLLVPHISGSAITISGSAAVAYHGISGSLTRLHDGTSYLIAGAGINISSASNGSITISGDGEYTATASTSDDTPNVPISISLSNDTVALIDASIVGNRTDSNARIAHKHTACIFRSGSNAATLGNLTSVYTFTSGSGASDWSSSIFPNTNDIGIAVVGSSSTDINWNINVKVITVGI